MKRFRFGKLARLTSLTVLALGLAVVGLTPWPGTQDVHAAITVYKSATCGCCEDWVKHLRENGFAVKAMDVADMRTVKARHGVPSTLASCHTAVVDGYVVEGHVPAKDVKRMLRERPAVKGIAVPGMPIGAPGMEQGGQTQPYTVVAFDEQGKTDVYARH